MERLDFASAMGVLRRNINEEICPSQLDLIEVLLPTESEDARFLRHSRFLRSLREDSLLIVDNFNGTPGEDAFLDELLKYRLRILFTTRSRYEEQPSLEVKELDKEELLALIALVIDDCKVLNRMCDCTWRRKKHP